MNKTKTMSLTLCSVLGVFMVSGSAATTSYAVSQALPSCSDPTGQNLPCMMIISTLLPPPNSLQCQETSGQILPCSYTTQNLSNGEQIVAITVYVPANYVFSSPTAIKVVVHTTTTKIIRKIIRPSFICLSAKGSHWQFVHGMWRCVPYVPPPNCTPLIPCPIKPPTCDSKYYIGPCPPTDENAYTKCISAALGANDNKNGLACARLLPDTPENAYTKCISEALFNDDNIAALKCAKLLPSPTQNAHNLTNTTTGAAATQPTNTSTTKSPSAKSGPSCTGNCTSGTPPPADCKKNPNDPSCTQALQPLSPPTTKTCPDGTIIDASANCPIQSTPPPTNPNTPSTPPSTSGTPPPSNNPSPSGSNNGGGGSSSGSGGSGSGSGEGSGPSQAQ